MRERRRGEGGGDIETGIGTGGRSVRENRVRDVTTKEPRRGVEKRMVEGEREREMRRGRRRLAVIRWGERAPGNSSQRPKTGSLCSTKETSGAQNEEDLSILQAEVTLSSNLFLGPNSVLSKIPSLIESSVFQ